MEEVVRQALLAAGYTSEEIQLETREDGRVRDFLISASFTGISPMDRQDLLWAKLAPHVTPEQMRRVRRIHLMTPDEAKITVRAPRERPPGDPAEKAARRALIAAGYTTDEIRLATSANGYVTGAVFSRSFTDISQIERQNLLWAKLAGLLTPEELRDIVGILTMTPDEVEDEDEVRVSR